MVMQGRPHPRSRVDRRLGLFGLFAEVIDVGDGKCRMGIPVSRAAASARSSIRLGHIVRGWLVQGRIEEAHHFVFKAVRPLAPA